MRQYIINSEEELELKRERQITLSAVSSPYWCRYFAEMAGFPAESLAANTGFAIGIPAGQEVALRMLQGAEEEPIDYICKPVEIRKVLKSITSGLHCCYCIEMDCELLRTEQKERVAPQGKGKGRK